MHTPIKKICRSIDYGRYLKIIGSSSVPVILFARNDFVTGFFYDELKILERIAEKDQSACCASRNISVTLTDYALVRSNKCSRQIQLSRKDDRLSYSLNE